jgi:hypothetical protein
VHFALEFPFRLEPIVQVTAVFFASFNEELACATSDFFVKSRVPYGARCLSSPQEASIAWDSVLSSLLAFVAILIPFLV